LSLENNIFHCHRDLVVPIWFVVEDIGKSSVYLVFLSLSVLQISYTRTRF
jgi:hypothetical protein